MTKSLVKFAVVSIIVIIVTVHTHAHAAVLFADDFESGVVSTSWTMVEGFEVIADPTGERLGFVASPAMPDVDNLLIKNIPIGPETTVRGFFYENGAVDGDDNAFGFDGLSGSTNILVRSSDGSSPSSFDFYLFDPEGGAVITTSIGRTIGWHEFRLEVMSSQTNAIIDGTTVGSSPITTYEFFFLVSEHPGGNPVYWDDICIFTTGDEADCSLINVNIDIKPGSFPNSINLGSGGTTAVAILGSATSLDVNDINPDTLTLGTAGVKTVGKTDRTLCSVADVSGDFSAGLEGASDGFLDLVCHFITMDIAPEAGDTTATISGELNDGTAIEGTDSVNIVP